MLTCRRCALEFPAEPCECVQFCPRCGDRTPGAVPWWMAAAAAAVWAVAVGMILLVLFQNQGGR